MTTFEVRACYHVEYSYETKQHTHFPEQPTTVAMHITVASADEAAAIAAKFPKSCGIKNRGATLWANVRFSANKTTGEKNETGMKRYRSFIKVCEKFGFAIDWNSDRCINAYVTRADFERAIGLEG